MVDLANSFIGKINAFEYDIKSVIKIFATETSIYNLFYILFIPIDNFMRSSNQNVFEDFSKKKLSSL